MMAQKKISPRFLRGLSRSINLLTLNSISLNEATMRTFRRKNHHLMMRTLEWGSDNEETLAKTRTLMIQLFPYINHSEMSSEWFSLVKKVSAKTTKPPQRELAYLFLNCAKLLNQQNQSDKAEPYLKKAEVAAFKAGDADNLLLAEISSAQSITAQRNGNADEAIRLSQHALTLIEHTDASSLAAMIHNNLAMNYRTKGKLQIANEHFDAALEKIDQEKHPISAARYLYNQAVVYRDLEKPEKGLELIAQSEILLANSDNYYDLISLKINEGGCHFDLKQHDRAEKAFRQAQEWLNKSVGLDYFYALTEVSLGNLYLKTRQYAQATAALRRAIDLWANLEPEPTAQTEINLANAIGTLGEVYKAVQDVEQATSNLQAAISIVQKHPDHLWAKHLKVYFENELQSL